MTSNVQTAAGVEADVATPSLQHRYMQPMLQLIADIRAGAPAIRAAGERYLPKWPKESRAEYDRRRTTAPWRPEFVDALTTLSAKPFAKPVSLPNDTPEKIRQIAEDIDGRGNNLHVFARELFQHGLADGFCGILVDFPPAPEGETLADERQRAPKPYWSLVRAADLLAVHTEMVDGREVVTHVRIRESSIERDGQFGEKTVERVRVLEPGRWALWEKQEGGNYQPIQAGAIRRGNKTSVPLALFFTGERIGAAAAKPPLLDLAHLQIELYRAMSRQEEILTYAGSPMLAAVGMAEPSNGAEIEVGPRTVLFAPPTGDGTVRSDWKYVQPNAENIREVREHVRSVIEDMRRLALQPLTQKSGAITATATSVEAAKAHSAVEAWALALKDTLEQAMVFTAEWLGETQPITVSVHTDFGIGIQSNEEAKTLLTAQTAGVISRRTLWDEFQRRGILGPQFDPNRESEELQEEGPPLADMRDHE